MWQYVSPRVTFTISFWASASRFYAASNSNVSHLDRDLDLLSFLSPLCYARVLSRRRYFTKVKPARHVYITASLSISFRESVLLPNLSHLVGIAKPFVLRAQLRFLLIILLSILLFSLYLSFSLHLSASFLYLSLHSLRFARGKDSFVSCLSRENERKRFQVEH